MTPLRIGIDARELLGDTTGVGRYLGELVRRWCARPDANRRQFLLYASEPLRLPLPSGTTQQRVVGRGTGTWWEQTALYRAVRADKPDVFFAPAYTAPLGIGIPLAVTIHDVSFSAHPEWFRRREGLRRRLLTRRTARQASIVITDSEFSRREIEKHLGINASRIEVIYPGVTGTMNQAGGRTLGAGTAESTALTPEGPLVLYVGSLFNRRRLPVLIAAFAQATADIPTARLVIVGADRTWPRQDLAAVARANAVESRVELRDYVAEDELSKLYSRASAFAFLSEYEGFGLTPLEAMAASVPVVVLDTPVAREIYGDAVAYVRDVDGAAAELRRLITAPAADATRIKASAILARYSWDRASDHTLDLLERIARK